MLTHEQLRAKVPRVRREDVLPGAQFQTLVEHNLVAVALAMLNELNKEHLVPDDLESHADALAAWLMRTADRDYGDDYNDDDPHSMPAKLRLSREELDKGALQRAGWVLTHWNPRFLEHRARGGRHGRADGVRKGMPPRFTIEQLMPEILELPPREAKAKVQSRTGMSDATWHRLNRQFRDSHIT